MLTSRALLAILASALIFLAVACGGDTPSVVTEPPHTATPAATSTALPPTPTAAPVPSTTVKLTRPTTCPVAAALCAFAQRVEMALVAGQIGELFVGAVGLPVTCAGGPHLPLDGTYPLCDGAARGETRNGFEVGRFRSEGFTGVAEGAAGYIAEWISEVDPSQSDQVGPGEIRSSTIGCGLPSGSPDCNGAFALVFTAILKVPQRDLTQREFLELIFSVDAAVQPHVVAVFTGIGSLNRALVTGGDVEAGVIPGRPSTTGSRYLRLPD